MSGTYLVNGDKLTGLTVYSALPIGSVIATVSTHETGFLAFDGSEYNGADYPALYDKVKNLTAFQSETDGYFKLPNLAGRTIQQAESELGVLVDAGLPNIKGYFIGADILGAEPVDTQEGAFYLDTRATSTNNAGIEGGTSYGLGFDASKSNSIYSDDCDTVQPPALTLNFFIKAVDYVSLPQNAIDDEHTTNANVWSASKTRAEIDDKFNYSTEEKVIGEWIDGKPIYRKVFVLSTPISVTDQWTVLKVKENEDLILRGRWFSNTTVYNKNNFSGEFTEISNDSISGNIQAFNKSLVEPASVYMYILEYTKTTD